MQDMIKRAIRTFSPIIDESVTKEFAKDRHKSCVWTYTFRMKLNPSVYFPIWFSSKFKLGTQLFFTSASNLDQSRLEDACIPISIYLYHIRWHSYPSLCISNSSRSEVPVFAFSMLKNGSYTNLIWDMTASDTWIICSELLRVPRNSKFLPHCGTVSVWNGGSLDSRQLHVSVIGNAAL